MSENDQNEEKYTYKFRFNKSQIATSRLVINKLLSAKKKKDRNQNIQKKTNILFAGERFIQLQIPPEGSEHSQSVQRNVLPIHKPILYPVGMMMNQKHCQVKENSDNRHLLLLQEVL